jgi:hypothetical protein
MRAWGIQVGETSIELCSQLGQRRLLALLGALGQRRQNVQSPKFAILANPSSGGRPATIVARVWHAAIIVLDLFRSLTS